MNSNIEAFLRLAAHHPEVAALAYTDMKAAIAKAVEFEILLSPAEVLVLGAITKEALTAAIAVAKNADPEYKMEYSHTRGIRPDVPLGRKR